MERLIFAVSVHESAHGWVAWKLGDDIRTLLQPANPAKILVYFLKEKGAASTEPAD